MNRYEEELQKNLESGQTPRGDGLDVKAYREVFRVLEKDPEYELPAHFAERVVARVISGKQSSDSKDYIWFGAGIFFLAIVLVATALYTGFRIDFGFLNRMADYKGLVVFGILFIVFLNWLDKKLVRGRQFQQRI